jgi:P27 family predicted phage terminase small subunit
MRGRKPKPSWQNQLDGNPGKRARNRQEPQLPTSAAAFGAPPGPPAADTPPPPDPLEDVPPELRATPTAAAEWRRLTPMLFARKAVTDADRGALLALCLEWGRYVDAMAKVVAQGMVVLTPTGYPMQNPYLPIATKALSACRSLWPELGLTPSSRSRVRIGGEEPDTFSEFDDPPAAAAGTPH